MSMSETRKGWIRDGVGYIPLTRGRVTMVDPEDVEMLSQWNWMFTPGNFKHSDKGYAVRYAKDEDGKRYRLPLPNVLCPVGPGEIVDHINGDTTDNRRANLRPSTQAMNVANKAGWRKSSHSSKYKGVCFDTRTKKWRAKLEFFTDNEELAAKMYDESNVLRYGDFARRNVPEYRTVVDRLEEAEARLAAYEAKYGPLDSVG